MWAGPTSAPTCHSSRCTPRLRVANARAAGGAPMRGIEDGAQHVFVPPSFFRPAAPVTRDHFCGNGGAMGARTPYSHLPL